MTLQCYNGFDNTIAKSQVSAFGGSSSVTGRSGRGLAARRTNATANIAILPAALSTVYVGVAVRTTSIASAIKMLSFLAPDGTTVHVSVGWEAVTGKLMIWGPANTVVATATATISTAVWNYYEVKVIISDTVGVVEIRQDEVVVLTYNGDTRNGAATTMGFISAPIPSGLNVDYDDMWVDDAGYLGDKTVEWLTPNGNGSSSGWLGSDGNSVDNYLLVDDPTTSDMTDYVGASASGTLDLYAMNDLPAGYSVDAIQEVIYAQKSDAGTPPTLLPVAKGQAGTTRTDTALPPLSTTAQAFAAQIRTTDPDGNALTAARVNAMEVGVKIQ